MKRVLPFLCVVLLAGSVWAGEPIKIDAGKTQQPISPYIYGQFIEHLGRCIYGGLWAEMLEDRKFYYPIKDDFDPWGTASDRQWNAGPFQYLKASPWRVIGPGGTVTMDTAHAYAGAHSPSIKLPGDGSSAGIAQDGLAFVKGKEYVGHIVLAGDREAAPVIVRLVLGDGSVFDHAIDKLTDGYQSYPLSFTAPSSSDNVRVVILSKGKGSFRVGTLSWMPSDNIRGWRSDTVALLKELNAPIYRWPGGNFVSGYNWRDGIGDRDKRPPRKNPAWRGVEANDVGIHEYMELMDVIHSEPYVSVNTGLGTVEEVAQEIEYFNGPTGTPMGKLRAQNGHPEPYHVVWWAVGNEMFGNWQLGHMPLEEYVKKHNRVAEAMWKVDSTAKLVGVGNVGPWDEAMLKECAGSMNLLSEHIYVKEKTNVVAHVRQLADEIKRVADAHRKYRKDIDALAGKDIRISMDEWNYWYGDYLFGELGCRYHLKDALGVAKGFHEYFRNSDLFYMANYAQTVNVIGAIKTTPTASSLETTGLALELYRNHFGSIPIEVPQQPGDLDVSAAWTADKKAITVAIVNPLPEAGQVAIDWANAAFKTGAKQWVITGDNPNTFNDPGKTPNVTIQEKEATIEGNTLSAAPYSVVMYRLEVR